MVSGPLITKMYRQIACVWSRLWCLNCGGVAVAARDEDALSELALKGCPKCKWRTPMYEEPIHGSTARTLPYVGDDWLKVPAGWKGGAVDEFANTKLKSPARPARGFLNAPE
jgi:hypothetical protein